uniref:Uncharacterized protein n=1 Tax=Petromyzon marinus TaxID=7757 RepID=S4REU8_PETMA
QAKEIALTIGQAFEVAYRQYVDSGARDAEFRKQMASLCQRVVNLETENGQLKKQVQELKDMFKSTQIELFATGSKSPDSGVTDIFDMEPFSPL